MSVITKDTIQPSSGQALTIKDEGGAASITVQTDGDLTIAENTYLGSGKGIYFDGQTGSANFLDDYEEGTWTPTLHASTDFASVTYDSERSGTYTKIGNRVFISFRMKTDAVDNSPASGSVNIQGLPFTASSHVASDGGVSIGYNSGFTTKYPTGGWITGGSTTLNLVYWGSGNDTTALDVGNVATGANSNIITCHGHYFV